MMNRACGDTQFRVKFTVRMKKIPGEFCDGYQQLCSSFLYLLHRSANAHANANAGTGWGQADLNILWILSSLFLLYVQRTVTGVASIKFCNVTRHWLLPNQPGRTWEPSMPWIFSLWVSYCFFAVQSSRESQGAPEKPVLSRCRAM